MGTRARELADGPQPPPNSAIQIDARSTEHWRGISERAERKTPERCAAPMNSFSTPLCHTPDHPAQRRTALRAVLAAFPEATASGIRATYQGRALRPGGPRPPPGGYLRHLLGGQQPCPSKTTLTADVNTLRRENLYETGGEEIPSG